MVCLEASGAVVCLWDSRSVRVPYVPYIFDLSRHSSDFRSFQLPNTVSPRASNRYTQTARFATIRKLSACDDVFGALSTDGELFTFPLPEPKTTSGGEKVVIKPQLVWALRKAFTAVKVSEESLIVTNFYTSPIGFLDGC